MEPMDRTSPTVVQMTTLRDDVLKLRDDTSLDNDETTQLFHDVIETIGSFQAKEIRNLDDVEFTKCEQLLNETVDVFNELQLKEGFEAKLATPKDLDKAAKDLTDLFIKLQEDPRPLPIPNEIFAQITSYLTPEDYTKAKQVNKTWHDTLSQKEFYESGLKSVLVMGYKGEEKLDLLTGMAFNVKLFERLTTELEQLRINDKEDGLLSKPWAWLTGGKTPTEANESRIEEITKKIEEFDDIYKTGEVQILLMVGPDVYRDLPNLEDLTEGVDYEFKIPDNLSEDEEASAAMLKMYSYQSSKYPMVKYRGESGDTRVAFNYSMTKGETVKQYTCLIREKSASRPFDPFIDDSVGKVFQIVRFQLDQQALKRTAAIPLGSRLGFRGKRRAIYESKNWCFFSYFVRKFIHDGEITAKGKTIYLGIKE